MSLKLTHWSHKALSVIISNQNRCVRQYIKNTNNGHSRLEKIQVVGLKCNICPVGALHRDHINDKYFSLTYHYDVNVDCIMEPVENYDLVFRFLRNSVCHWVCYYAEKLGLDLWHIRRESAILQPKQQEGSTFDLWLLLWLHRMQWKWQRVELWKIVYGFLCLCVCWWH